MRRADDRETSRSIKNKWWWLGLIGLVLLGMFLYDRWPVQYSEHDAELDQIYDRLFHQESYADVNNEVQLQDHVPGVYYIPKPDSPQTYESWLELDRIKGKRVVKDQEAKWVLEAVYAYDDFDAEMLEACRTVVRELEKVSMTGVFKGEMIVYLNEFTYAPTPPNQGAVYTKGGVISKKYSDQDIYQKFKPIMVWVMVIMMKKTNFIEGDGRLIFIRKNRKD